MTCPGWGSDAFLKKKLKDDTRFLSPCIALTFEENEKSGEFCDCKPQDSNERHAESYDADLQCSLDLLLLYDVLLLFERSWSSGERKTRNSVFY